MYELNVVSFAEQYVNSVHCLLMLSNLFGIRLEYCFTVCFLLQGVNQLI